MTKKTLSQRVQSFALIHGMSIVLFSAVCTLAALLLQNWIGLLVGLLVVICGMLEYFGARKVLNRPLIARRYLAGAQGGLFLVLIGYCIWASQHTDAYALLEHEQVRAQLTDHLRQAGLSYTEFAQLLDKMLWLFYALVGLVSFVYQGSLALYYWRQARRIMEEDSPPPLPGNTKSQ